VKLRVEGCRVRVRASVKVRVVWVRVRLISGLKGS
jgi:hypothetical protein